MTIPTEVRSVLQDGQLVLAEGEPEYAETFANTVTPLRFDFRWECDSNGFTAGQGPLILPAFSVDNPFCLDTRDEANSSFAGFDVVSASGAPVGPGESVIWTFRAVTPQLGAAMQQMFRLAEQSEACCQEAGGCQAVPQNTNLMSCQNLQNSLNAVAPGQFSLQQPETVTIWRPFYIYTAAGADALDTGGTPPNYPMRLRGVYEGINAAGDLITSTEFIRDVGFCLGGERGVGDRCTFAVTETCLDF